MDKLVKDGIKTLKNMQLEDTKLTELSIHMETAEGQILEVDIDLDSFTGEILKEASKDKEEIITAEINLEENHLFRRNWGLFRDRRTDLYKELLTLDGEIKD